MSELEKANADLDELVSSLARVRKLASAIPEMVKRTNAALAYQPNWEEVGREEEYIEGAGWEGEFSEEEWEQLKRKG